MLIVTAYKIPSLNKLFNMNPWDRHKERRSAHVELLYGLRASGDAFLTRTTSSVEQSILWTAYDTLASYLETARTKSNCKSDRSKSATKPKRKPKSNSNLGNPR